MTKSLETTPRLGRQFRSTLIASVAVGAMLAGMSSPAHALLPVIDSASVAQLVHSAVVGAKQLATLEEQLAQLEKTFGVSKQQLEQAISLYTSFSHITNVSQLAPLLLKTSTMLALPEVANVESLMRGIGFVGTLASQAQAMLTKLQVYKPSGGDFTASQMNNDALATAGQMTTAETLYKSQTDRINGLADMELDLAKSNDPKETADMTARIGIENGLAAAQANQVAALQVMQRAQEDTSREQAEQTWRQGADDLLQQAQAAEAAAGSGS